MLDRFRRRGMRRRLRIVLSVALIVLGVPLLLAGGTAAFFVGPDDTVPVARRELSTDDSVISTTTTVTRFTGPTVHIDVDAGDTEMFVGAASPIHVDSYLTDVAQETISDVTMRGEISSAPVTGAKSAPDTPPDELDWWDEHASGTGRQSISFELTEQPRRVVIAPLATGGSLNVALDVSAEIDGLFMSAILVGAVGLVLALTGTLLLWSRPRRRQRKAASKERSDDGDGPSADTEARPKHIRRTPPPAPQPPPQPTPRLVAVVGLAALVAGCAELPQQMDDPPTTSPVAAITPARAGDFFNHYTATTSSADGSQDASLLATVEAGTLLETTQFGYEEQQATGGTPREPATVAPSSVAAPRFDSYPMWSIVTTLTSPSASDVLPPDDGGYPGSELPPGDIPPGDVPPDDVAPGDAQGDVTGDITGTESPDPTPTDDSEPTEPAENDEPQPTEPGAWYLLTRENAGSPWLARLAVRPSVTDGLPEPLTEDGAAVAAAEDAATNGRQVLDELVAYGSSGVAPENVDLTNAAGLSQLPTHGLQLDTAQPQFGTSERTCELGDPEQIHWLATRYGAFTLASISCTQTMQTNPGFSVRIDDAGLGTIPGGAEIVQSSITQSASFILSVDDDGSATVVGQPMQPVSMSYTASSTPSAPAPGTSLPPGGTGFPPGDGTTLPPGDGAGPLPGG